MDIQEKIYDKVSELSDMTFRQESRLGNIDSHLKELNGTIIKHEKRFDKNEEKICKLVSIKDKIAGAIILLSIAWTVFTCFVK